MRIKNEKIKTEEGVKWERKVGTNEGKNRKRAEKSKETKKESNPRKTKIQRECNKNYRHKNKENERTVGGGGKQKTKYGRKIF